MRDFTLYYMSVLRVSYFNYYDYK